MTSSVMMRVPRVLGLLAHVHHQFRARDARRKAGEILDLGRQVELPERQRAAQAVFFGNRAFNNERLKVGAGPRKWRPSNRRGRNR